MVVEIEDTETEQTKLVVICRMCNLNFEPGPLECPYLYEPKLGLHIPLCQLCRATLRKEEKESR